jgi:hypothetical protein
MPLNVETFVVRELEKISVATALFHTCEQDDEANHVQLIEAKIKNGHAILEEVFKDGKSVGFSCVEIFNGTLYVLALACHNYIDAFNTLVPVWKKQAVTLGCSSISFQTLRAGLMKTALNNGFKLSSVELRFYVK